jgi:hypothetical protein
MKTVKNLDSAFESFEREISEMNSDEFWSMLGTSIDELREKQRLDTEYDNCINSSFVIFKSNFDFKYLAHDTATVPKCICASVSSCRSFEIDQAAFAA